MVSLNVLGQEVPASRAPGAKRAIERPLFRVPGDVAVRVRRLLETLSAHAAKAEQFALVRQPGPNFALWCRRLDGLGRIQNQNVK